MRVWVNIFFHNLFHLDVFPHGYHPVPVNPPQGIAIPGVLHHDVGQLSPSDASSSNDSSRHVVILYYYACDEYPLGDCGIRFGLGLGDPPP